jgi:hypothetical protein
VAGRSTRSLASTGSSLIKQFDIVRINSLSVSRPQELGRFREPRPGDHAVVLELLQNPPGYYLEGKSEAGDTIWVEPFASSDIAIEVVGPLVTNGSAGAV